jgi:hypothetical protein
MAEVQILVGDHPRYDDGDVLIVYNDRKIWFAHAHDICWPRQNRRKVGGFLGSAFPLLEKMFAHIYQYKFTRTSTDEVVRLNLWNLDEDVCGPNVADPTLRMDVSRYVSERKWSGKKPLFGSDGFEIWYGGNENLSLDNVNSLWNIIENDTPYRKVNFSLWNCGRELYERLCLPIPDIDEAILLSLIQAWFDNDLVIKRRKFQLPWRHPAVLNYLGLTENEVLDKGKKIDKRVELAGVADEFINRLVDKSA